jgi:hypothetical protein
MGIKLRPTQEFGIPTEPYQFPVQLRAWVTIRALFDRASPLRSSHMRDPVGSQLGFASESFTYELAHAAGADAIAFRLAYLQDPRAIAAIGACAASFRWQERVAGSIRAAAPVVTAADSPTPSAIRPSWRWQLRSKSTAPPVVSVRAAGPSRTIAAR